MNQKFIDVERPASGSAKASPAEGPLHALPPLPYGYSALEPVIDARTMKLHHDMHHAAYVEKLNAGLAPFAELRRRSASWLLSNIESVPESVRIAVRNDAGGHLNHSMFWRTMAPAGGAGPGESLTAAIEKAFGSLDVFKTRFDEAGAALFGSGWVWLVARVNGVGERALEIVTTPGHENPVQQGMQPLLVNDVWEHAYYLKHENRRPEYLKDWWSIVNWTEMAHRFAHPDESIDVEPSEESLPAATK